jgi:hypothetical protein
LEKGSVFNKWGWENGISILRRLEIDFYLSPYTEIYSRWDFNVRSETLQLLQINRKNTGRYRHRQQLPEQDSNTSGNKGKN